MEDIARAALQAGATPQEAAILTSIAMPESSGVANILNPNRKTGDESYGLWQINMLGRMGPERMRKFGLSSKTDLYDPVTNAKAALQLLRKGGGLRNWTTYTHGKHKPFYSQAANVVSKLTGNPDLINQPLPEVSRTPVMSASVGAPGALSLTSGMAQGQPRRGLLSRLVSALSPVSSAQASEGSVLNRINPADPSGPLLPESTEPRKESFGDVAARMRGYGKYDYAPGVSEQKDIKTDFGNLRQDRDMLAETPYAQTMAGAPLTSFEEVKPSGEPPAEPRVVSADTAQPEKRERESDKKYWGDWRDAEPWASDPIGGFFDELSGEQKRASRPGRYEPSSGFDFGNFFAAGGAVEEDDNPFGDIGSAIEAGFGGIGDALGGLFGEGKNARSAEEAAVVARDEAPTPTGMSPLKQALIAAGLGMMASPSNNPLTSIGMGGLKGFQVYEAAAEQERKRAEDAAQKASAERAAEEYQRRISGSPVSEDEVPEERVTTSPAGAPKVAAEPSAEVEVTAPASKTSVLDPETVDIEADPTLRRLSQRYAQISGIPAPAGMASVKSAQLSNLKFQIEERRKQLESSARARKAQVEAEQRTPEAKARAKQLESEQEALAKESVATEQAARQADQRIATLSRMKDAVESERFPTGFGAETKLSAKKAIQSVLPGMVDEEAIAMAEQFEKDALQAVTDATGGKLGAGVSDSDVRFLTRQQAGLGTSKAGNVRTLDAAIKVEQRKKDIAQFARDYRKAHNGVLDQGYYEELSKWAEANPMFSDSTQDRKVKSADQPSGGKTIVKTGTLNGRKVVKYSDGTTAYAD
jgi:hypothetical protein